MTTIIRMKRSLPSSPLPVASVSAATGGVAIGSIINSIVVIAPQDGFQTEKGRVFKQIILDPSTLLQLQQQLNSAAQNTFARNLLATKKSPSSKYIYINTEELECINIIAELPTGCYLTLLSTCFPLFNWKRQIVNLCRKKLITNNKKVIKPTKSGLRQIEKQDSNQPYTKRWIKALLPYRYNQYIASLLMILNFKLNRHERGLLLLCDMIDALEGENHVINYEKWFELFLKRRNKFSSTLRIRIFNSLGHCYSQKDVLDKAIKTYHKLRKESEILTNDWGLKQSYINCGVAYWKNDQRAKAMEYYKMAIAHAERTKDNFILGRALENLGLALLDEEQLELAEQYMNQARALKIKFDKSRESKYVSILGSAKLLVKKGEPVRALVLFLRASALAKRMHSARFLCIALQNLSNCYGEIGRRKEQFAYLRQAQKIATTEQFNDLIAMCLQSEGVALAVMGRFERGAAIFAQLSSIEKKRGDTTAMLRAVHDQAVCLIKQAKSAEARKVLAVGIRTARKLENHEYIFSLLALRALLNDETGKSAVVKVSMLSSAKAEKIAGRYLVAGRLLIECLRIYLKNHVYNKMNKLYQRTVSFFNMCADPKKSIYENELYEIMFLYKQDIGKYEQALEFLDKIKSSKNNTNRTAYLVERGICYQYLDRWDEAEICFVKAISISVKEKNWIEMSRSLVCLGDSYLNNDIYSAAIEYYEIAQNVAQQTDDEYTELVAIYHQAIALLQDSQFAPGRDQLRKVLNLAKNRERWEYYLNAATSLAQHYMKLGQINSSQAICRKALFLVQNKDLVEKISLVEEYAHSMQISIQLALNANNLIKARKYIEQLDALPDSFISQKYRFYCCMTIGDYVWFNRTSIRDEAFDFYWQAFLSCIPELIRDYIKASSHVCRLLVDLDDDTCQAMLTLIRNRFDDYLPGQHRHEKKDSELYSLCRGLCLWPLEVVGDSMAACQSADERYQLAATESIRKLDMVMKIMAHYLQPDATNRSSERH